MKHLTIPTEKHDFLFHLPTSLKEIEKDYLEQITKDINLGEHYCLIALAYHDKASKVIFTCTRKKKDEAIGVIPLFVKAGTACKSGHIKNAIAGQKILMNKTGIELGTHINVPKHILTLNYFANIVCKTTNPDLYSEVLKEEKGEEVYFIEFKIVGESDIIAVFDDEQTKDKTCPFVEILTDTPDCK